MKDHLSRSQRNNIRYHIRATEQGVAKKYGISVATVRAVRAAGQPQHPARVAAIQRRNQSIEAVEIIDASGGVVSRTVVPPTDAPPPRGQTLHVEGGVDLPQPLS